MSRGSNMIKYVHQEYIDYSVKMNYKKSEIEDWIAIRM